MLPHRGQLNRAAGLSATLCRSAHVWIQITVYFCFSILFPRFGSLGIGQFYLLNCVVSYQSTGYNLFIYLFISYLLSG